MDNTLTSQNYHSNYTGTEIDLETINFDTTTLVNVEHIIGTAEVAAILGCPKQQIYTLRKRKDFPQPIRTIAATPLWDSNEVSKFASTWVRRKKRVVESV